MANRTLFQTRGKSNAPPADTVNEAGGLAYTMGPREALAQLVVTGCLSGTFYASAENQAETVLKAAAACDPKYVAQTALYARQRGYMKDMPALLCAHLAARMKTEPEAARYLQAIFSKVIDNGKMLRNFVQMIRSGALGRKSLGTMPRHLVAHWLGSRDADQVFRMNIGQQPTLADIIKLVHPRPTSGQHRALYGYLIGREYDKGALPPLALAYEAYKTAVSGKGDGVEVGAEPPRVPFEMLTSLPLSKADWKALAAHASWQQTRQLLNTFKRHDVFDDKSLVDLIAMRLASPEGVARARVFPYQLLTSYYQTDGVPTAIRNALQTAMDLSLANVPEINGQVVVAPDVSGSMSSPVTGRRGTATTIVTCRDVAALVSSALLRKNPNTVVLPFDDKIHRITLNGRDSVMTNTEKLAKLPAGGTDCSLPILHLIQHGIDADLVILVSDNESWIDSIGKTQHRTSLSGSSRPATGLMEAWERYRKMHQNARLVCMDLAPYETRQAVERADILNVGGFSDMVFDLLPMFSAGELKAGAWVSQIETIAI